MNPAAIEKQQLLNWMDGQGIAHSSNATLRQLQKLAYENGYVPDRPTSPVVQTKFNASSDNDPDIPADPNLENDADTLTPVVGKARIPEEEELDAAIRILQKRALLTKLMAESSSVKEVIRAMVPFSNPRDQDAGLWIMKLERACSAVDESDAYKLRCARLLMAPNSEADTFMRLDTSENYDQFKTNFLKTFDKACSTTELVMQLQKTFYIPAKTSVMGYILQMQELALRASVCEIEAVHFIIDGFRDTSPAFALLYGAKTFNELKELSHRYADLRAKNKPKWNSSTISSALTSASAQSSLTSNGEMRCYNCSLFGHYASDCKAPKRAKGSCIRCGSLSHTIKTCPEQKYTKSAMEPKTPRYEDSDEYPFVPIFDQRR
ncbi:uncharacterized protein [Drosophila pseudoobscura]|uniref:CCHC-type domain-containing protein n=1 Tax=Drosophila pseudoobscura pseudoobscura TaxID=46245 RepID=A0A6I8W1U0_DROPS|nr:uncharacterized protein LOC117184352 [Drosophila pseudoobscura]